MERTALEAEMQTSEKIGIIDLGSNSARLVIVRLFGGGYFMVEDELKESVRLGQDMDRDGFLKPQRVAETNKTLKMFKRLCDASGVTRIIAVATAAVRRAKNQRSFLDEIQATCGIRVEVLSEEAEATLVYRGVINSMDIPKGIILEIGGGSTKIIYYNRRTVLHYASLSFGAVTLTDLFADDGVSPEEQTRKIEEFFTEQFKKIEWLAEVEPDVQMIGVGGSFRNLYKINRLVRKYPLNTVHNYSFAVEDFRSIYERCAFSTWKNASASAGSRPRARTSCPRRSPSSRRLPTICTLNRSRSAAAAFGRASCSIRRCRRRWSVPFSTFWAIR